MEEISEILWVFIVLLFVGIYVFIKNLIEILNKFNDIKTQENDKNINENERT